MFPDSWLSMVAMGMGADGGDKIYLNHAAIHDDKDTIFSAQMVTPTEKFPATC